MRALFQDVDKLLFDELHSPGAPVVSGDIPVQLFPCLVIIPGVEAEDRAFDQQLPQPVCIMPVTREISAEGFPFLFLEDLSDFVVNLFSGFPVTFSEGSVGD